MSVLNWSGILSAPLARPARTEPAEELVLDVRDLRMRYGRADVLHGVTFSARQGEVLALLGPNGAGKTTTIEILEGFRMRSAGQVSVLGADPAHGGEAWRARIGVVLQSWRDHAKWQVRELLFLDEPTAGFDPEARREFHDLVHRLADREETTILLTTHDLDEAEKLRSGRPKRGLTLRVTLRCENSRWWPDERGLDGRAGGPAARADRAEAYVHQHERPGDAGDLHRDPGRRHAVDAQHHGAGHDILPGHRDAGQHDRHERGLQRAGHAGRPAGGGAGG